ncbi:glycosyltransferase family 4 protein [Simiduia sp. 21SJ11W-1]|uniref:glycosyltransferase n=1 Tax=Simiduia sp. 21SJ11W-1 TaxID=2909669 RepID=UPI00209E728A|nr:glycosyltransferase [Simiduia sp. 21SJ11W-1]UTA49073.1 glycosyltransferase family 4 protein [Simiduia sp. 21SJ11W-1]
MQQNLLIVGYVWPEPRSSAAGTRIVQLIQWAQAAGYVVTFASAAEPGEGAADLPALGVACEPIALNCSSFDRWVAALGPAVVIFDRFVCEEQFGWRVAAACPTAVRLLDSEDLHCLRDARARAHKAGQPVLVPTDADLFSEMAQRELASIYRCDLTLVISDAEITLLTERLQVPVFLLHHCPFMFAPAQKGEGKPFDARRHFVFIGNYRHAPNWDAVRYLREIWPAIRASLPDAELHLYGAYPPKKAMQLDNPALGFRVLGWAPDALAVLGAARVCLAPLRFGAGIKGKLAEAMACETPSVTTPIGAEGMTALGRLAWPGAVASDSEGLVAAAVALYQNEAHWQAASARCVAHFNALFDFETQAQALSAQVLPLLAPERLTAHRRRNITGAMLAQNARRASEFMSRWIEVKTQLATYTDADS